MTRISDRIVVQLVEEEGIVVMDESAGSEIVIRLDDVARFAQAVEYLAAAAAGHPTVDPPR